ncbi:beta-lactamase family protein [Sphingomonas sinipercae]|uniref:Beta-lactamase family protein n=1 Tax=Sphingomonas sinipercae TaxID=2714944 RepID=A0A6G7ZPX1_9SPHN|nr:serine hydrolase domain-containing protein [Sphingomonas sinipercae]QIL03037.1 beta-lactamase family protein [Sphingomonas sinipercae]
MIAHRIAAALLCSASPVAAAQMNVDETGSHTVGLKPITVEQRAREVIEIVGGSSEMNARRYISESFSAAALERVGKDDRLEDMEILRHELGTITIDRIDRVSPTEAVAVVRSGLTGRLRAIAVEVDRSAPAKIADIGTPRTLSGQISKDLSDAQRVTMLDNFVSRLAKTGYFSGTVLLAREGHVLHAKAYGLAERRFGVPNAVNTRFNLGSITKIFTAVALAQLVERGRVSWDDTLNKYVPGFPNDAAASQITLKHLLTHTSGLTNTPYPPGPRSPTRALSVAELISEAPRNDLQWKPGTRYEYNNLGFLLLGRVIEVVSGQSYYDFVRDHVFKPAGMATVGTDRYDFVTSLAYAYEPLPAWDRPSFVDGRLYVAPRAVPFGGAYSSAPDIFRFSEALRSGRLIRPSTLRTMASAHPELGAPMRGLGFNVGSDDWVVGVGRKILGHGGNTAGVCTEWRQIEDAEAPYTFVVLSNSGQRACFPVAEFILDLVPAENSQRKRR